ncbi:hypothetical protein [Methyloglobulus sp.]|uniref:hypothetical protein n=1 Tax=Methyloglobulus sp. TaxID=2518622 RepID=UPI0032B78599
MSFKKVLLPMALLSAAGFSGISWGHVAAGTTGGAIMDVDVYHTSCFSYTSLVNAEPGEVLGAADRFSAKIKRNVTSPAGNVRVTLGRITGLPNPSPSPFANNAAGTTNFGACASITSAVGAGNGLYSFAVSHDTAVANGYQVDFHCEKLAAIPCSGNFHTGTGVLTTTPALGSTAGQAPNGVGIVGGYPIHDLDINR